MVRSREHVHHAGRREKDADDTAKDDDRNEVGHVQHQLNLLLDLGAEYAVEQERQQDRRRESPQKAEHAQFQGVHQVGHEVRRGQEALEVRQSHPFAVPQAAERVVVHEGDRHAAHRDVAEDDRQHERWQHEDQVELPVLPQIHQSIY